MVQVWSVHLQVETFLDFCPFSQQRKGFPIFITRFDHSRNVEHESLLYNGKQIEQEEKSLSS